MRGRLLNRISPRFLAPLLVLIVLSCTDGVRPNTSEPSYFRAPLLLAPRISSLSSAFKAEPVNRIRLTVRHALTAVVLATQDLPVDPNAAQWQVEFEVELPGGAPVPVVAEAELLDGDIVQWSGRLELEVAAQATPVVHELDVFRGPLDNFWAVLVAIQGGPLSMLEGGTLPLNATVQVDGNPNARPQVFWLSLDPTVATVGEASGVVTGVSPGIARIVAIAGRASDQVEITVRSRPASIQILPESIAFDAFGLQAAFTADVLDTRGDVLAGAQVAWSAEDPAVAAHEAGGSFMAVGNGVTTAIATSVDDPSIMASVPITVRQIVAGLELFPTSLRLVSLGETAALTASAVDPQGHDVGDAVLGWSSADPNVASVDANGVVTAVGTGMTTITGTASAPELGVAEGRAALQQPVEASITVEVTQAAFSVVVTPSEVELGAVGETTQFEAQIVDALGVPITDVMPVWSSTHPEIASIDVDGLATAHAVGTTAIQAAVDGIVGQATLTVVAADLIVSLFEVLPGGAPGSVITAADVFFRVEVFNLGPGAAAATGITIDVRDSGTDALVGQLTFPQPALDPGTGFLLEEFGAGQWAALTLPAGVYFEARTDPHDGVVEGDEANNSIVSADFTVLLTAINKWINPAGGNWSNASNWSLGHVPDLTDGEVVIDLDGTYTVTMDVNSNVKVLTVGGGTGVQTLAADGRTLTLDGASTVASTGELRLTNTTVDGTGSLNNGGLLTVLPGTDNIDVPFTQSGSVVLNGNNGNAILTVANGFTNAGTIDLTGTSWAGVLNVSAGTLTNGAGATIQATGGSTNQITATVDNQGTILVQDGLQFFNSGRTLTSTSGTFDVAAGQQVEINGGTTEFGTGTGLVGTGTINWTGTTVTLVSDVTVASGAPTWAFGGTNAVTINGAGTLINQSSLMLQNETVDVAIDNQATGMITVLPGLTWFNDAVTQAGTIVLNGNNGHANLYVPNNSFTNSGTIELTGTSWAGILQVSSGVLGTLTNASGATIRSTAGSNNQITGHIDNQGTIHVQKGLLLNAGDTDTTTGTLNVESGHTLQWNSGTITLGSATGLVGTGTLLWTGTTMTLGSDVTVESGEPAWTFAPTVPVTINGPGTLINQASLTFQDEIVNADLDNEATGTITVLPGTTQLNGAVTQAGTIVLNGNNGDANLTVANGFTNAGTIDLTGTSWAGLLNVSAGTLTNGAGATIQATGGSTNQITATVDNQGTILVQDGLKFFNTGRTLTSTSGTFNVAAGQQVEINGGVTTLGTATGLVGTGTINWTGTTVTLASDVTVAAGAPTWAFGTTNAVTINGAGTLINQASLTFENEIVDADLDNQATGTITVQPGTTQFNGAVTQAGTIVLNGNNGDANLTVANGFTNAGTIDLTGSSWAGVLNVSAGTLTNGAGATIQATGGSTNHITATVDNQGTILVQDGLKFFNAGRTLTSTSGTFNVAAGQQVEINGGVTTLGSSTGLVGTGTINWTGTTVTLASDVTVASGAPTWAFGTSNAVTINGAGTLINQASLTFENEIVDADLDNQATGTITVQPGTTQFNGAVTQAGTIVLNGNNGDANLTVANGFTNTGTIDLTGTSWAGVLNVSAGTLTNGAGATIQATGGSTNHITATVDNQGTILVQDGLKFFNAGRTLTSTSGTFNVAAGQQVEINGGVTTLGSSTGLVGTGTINWTGTTVTLASDVTVASGAPTWAFGTSNAVTINGAGTLINQASLTFENEIVDADLDNQATGTITVQPGTTQFNGAVTQAGTIVLNGNNGDANLTVANGFTNTGTIDLTGTSWAGLLTVSAGTLTNMNVISATGGATGQITATIDNQGTLLSQDGLKINNSGRTLTSTTGTLSVSAGQPLEISGGTTTLGSSTGLVGTGTLDWRDTPTITLSSDVTVASGAPTWTFGGGTAATINGPGTLINQVSLTMINEIVNAPINNQATGTITVLPPGTTQFNGSVTQAGAITLNGNNGPAQLTVANGFTNTGTIELTGTSWAGFLTVSAGTLTNSSVIQATGGATNQITATLNNQGTIIVNDQLDLVGTVTHASGALLQGTSTLDITGASLTFNGDVNPGAPGTAGTSHDHRCSRTSGHEQREHRSAGSGPGPLGRHGSRDPRRDPQREPGRCLRARYRLVHRDHELLVSVSELRGYHWCRCGVQRGPTVFHQYRGREQVPARSHRVPLGIPPVGFLAFSPRRPSPASTLRVRCPNPGPWKCWAFPSHSRSSPGSRPGGRPRSRS